MRVCPALNLILCELYVLILPDKTGDIPLGLSLSCFMEDGSGLRWRKPVGDPWFRWPCPAPMKLEMVK